MNTTQLRSQLKEYIDNLSPESLERVAEFMTDLVNQDLEDATEELLKIEGFQSAFDRGKEQIKKGRVKDWRIIRDDV